MTEQGFEEIPLNLSSVPTVEVGLEDAAARYKRFTHFAKEALRFEKDSPLFLSHLPLMSFINRATSLHAGVVSAVKADNPHAAFTLLRAYLELVALLYYVDAYLEYIEALRKPLPELPKGTRKRFSELFTFAAREMAGIHHTYAVLNVGAPSIDPRIGQGPIEQLTGGTDERSPRSRPRGRPAAHRPASAPRRELPHRRPSASHLGTGRTPGTRRPRVGAPHGRSPSRG